MFTLKNLARKGLKMPVPGCARPSVETVVTEKIRHIYSAVPVVIEYFELHYH